MTESLSTTVELDRLPTGSVIVDLGPERRNAHSPVVACKTGFGDWQTIGDHPERRWRSREIARDAAGNLLLVVYNPEADHD